MTSNQSLGLFDFPSIHASKQQIIKYNKIKGYYNRLAQQESKPDRCILCGQPKTSYCKSHSLPKFCLRSIAVNGNVLSMASLLDANIHDRLIGISKAGTFRIICNECDNSYFKAYEDSSSWQEPPNQRLMGLIAVKTCLAEIAEARQQAVSHRHIAEDYESEGMHQRAGVRIIDSRDDLRNLETARLAAERGNRGFKLLYYKVLPYTVPVAIQTLINPIVDFEGNPINNLFEYSQSYYIEPLYVCIFPMKNTSVITVFRNRRTDRYNAFQTQLESLNEIDAMKAILALCIAYSEDIYYSPSIENILLNSTQIVHLSRMNIDSLGEYAYGKTEQGMKRNILKHAGQIYAIGRLMDIPNLLDEDYSIDC